MSPVLVAFLTRVAKWFADWEYQRAQKRIKARKLNIKLSAILFCCMLSQGCATWDTAYVWTYETINGTNTMEAVCGTK